ncbi:MAG: alpha/beta hydrolase, partial [Acidiphilium sp. 37-67-22]
MPSLASHIVNPLIRAIVKSQLSADVSGRTEAAIARRVRRALGTPVLPPPGGRYVKGECGGIPGLW